MEIKNSNEFDNIAQYENFIQINLIQSTQVKYLIGSIPISIGRLVQIISRWISKWNPKPNLTWNLLNSSAAWSLANVAFILFFVPMPIHFDNGKALFQSAKNNTIRKGVY